MAWIALDAGTSVIKAVVFGDDGREGMVARRAVPVLHPQDDWSEQDMTAVWSAAAEAIRQCSAASAEAICGLACTAQGDGCWLISAEGHPTGNAILWNDGRAAPLIAEWQSAGVIERAFRISGSVNYPGLPNAILAWLDRNQPERVERARWVLTANGWLFSQLTGRIAAELSDACNPFCDVLTGVYSEAALELYGAHRHKALLPPVCVGTDAIGSLTEQAAATLGLQAGLPVVMAPYDIVSTAYGAGAASPGQACVILGTTICAETFLSRLDLSATPAGTTLAFEDGTYLRAMPTLTGCEALQWTAQMLGADGIEALSAMAEQNPRKKSRLFFLPYLSPAGERSPFLATEARGSFHGLSLATTRAELAHTVFEGLSFIVRECLEACNPGLHEVRVCGGGARSNLWCQMLADILQAPVVRTEGSEMGARGAHLHALAATGEIPSVAEGAYRHITIERTFTPSMALRTFYHQRYATFLELRETARAQWALLATTP